MKNNLSGRLSQCVALCGCALLLCFSLAASADEVQDINKLFRQGKTAQALERVNAYLGSKPKDAQARFLKGLILTEQDKASEAIRVFSELTEDYPELPEPYNNLAVLYASQGQFDKARIALEMAIRTHPSYATAHENLGDIYAKMASQAYDRALQLDHGNASTQTKLAMVKEIFAVSPAKAGKPGKTAHPAKPSVAETQAEASTTPEPASAPVAEAKPTSRTTRNDSSNLLKTVQGWAAAWSAKDAATYLAFYAPDFKTPGNVPRSDWEAQRQERIAKPKSIEVHISNPKVAYQDDAHASVTFKQSYRASHLKTSSSKTLVMVKSGDHWLIQEERAGK
jgi:tetratricopeptide (TPR) repeat protein